MFLPHEAKNILSIPLSTRLPQDSIIWSNPHPQHLLWRGVWTLRTPNKVKHFIWRACNNSLPTMDNLFHRQIMASDHCNICKTYPEDILHVVWGCLKVANLWKDLIWTQHAVSPPPGDFTNLFSSFLQVKDDYRVEFFAITSWLL